MLHLLDLAFYREGALSSTARIPEARSLGLVTLHTVEAIVEVPRGWRLGASGGGPKEGD